MFASVSFLQQTSIAIQQYFIIDAFPKAYVQCYMRSIGIDDKLAQTMRHIKLQKVKMALKCYHKLKMHQTIITMYDGVFSIMTWDG